MTRTGLLQALALAACVAALLAIRLIGERRGGADFTRVQRMDLLVTSDVSGVLRAVDTTDLGPPLVPRTSEFTITSLAPEGSQVKQGDVVIVFDQRARKRILSDQRAELEGLRKELEKTEAEHARERRDAELALAKAETDLRRARMRLEVPAELAGSHELKRAHVQLALAERESDFLRRRMKARGDVAAADVATQQLNIRRMEGRIKQGEEILERFVVRAPRDGTVIYRPNEKGEKKQVGDAVWRQTRIVELPDLSRMRADGEVDETDVGRVEVGQPVRLRLDAHPDQELMARVESIGNAVERPSAVSPIAIVRVTIVLDHTDPLRMRPGMRFRGQIELARVDRALVLPSDAIRPSAAGPLAYRRGLFGLEPVSLVLGRRNGRLFEVLGGLREGERVALLHGPDPRD